MASLGKLIGDSLKKLVFRELTVAQVTHLSEHFLRVEFIGEALRGARFTAGDKVQIAFDGGPRTYTPFSFDGERGAMSVLIYLHGDGPSARWAKAVTKGERVFAFGPRSSMSLEPGPIALFGDETSFGLARALLEARARAGDPAPVFEVTHPDECRQVLQALELPEVVLMQRRADDSHLAELGARLRAILPPDPGTRLALTGKASSIQALRNQLKAQPIPHVTQRVKAYWAPGKRGLD